MGTHLAVRGGELHAVRALIDAEALVLPFGDSPDVLAVNVDRDRGSLRCHDLERATPEPEGDGHYRPLVPADVRAELVASLACVDYVVVFDDATAEPVLRDLHPHVQCKGTDYTEENVPERWVMDELGGEVRIVGDPKNHSTRDLLADIARRADVAKNRG